MKPGRWPPQGPAARPDPGHDAYEAQFADLRRAIGDLTGVIARLAPAVQGCRQVALDATGQAQGNEKLPFAAIAVYSHSASQLTVLAGTQGGAAPGPGPGVAVIPPYGFRVMNASSYAWSIYGGSKGDLVDVETFARPQPPDGGQLGPMGPVTSAAAFAAAGNGTATLPAGVPLTGFDVTAAAAGGANTIVVTVTGAAGGTLTWNVASQSTAAAPPLIIRPPQALLPANPAVGIAVTATGAVGTPAGNIVVYGA